MPAWSEVVAEVPDFAARVEDILNAHLHKTMATLRRDGAPRISGTELTLKDGELWLGGDAASRKVQDLLRDPRAAIHNAPVDPEIVEGDAKLSAHAMRELDDAVLDRSFEVRPTGAIFFRLDINEVVLTRVADNRLEVELWTAAGGLRRLTPA